jgi:hypothetical protein
VFTVDAIHPSKVQSLAQSKASIKALLVQQQVSAAQAKLQGELTKTWTPQTNCRQGYTVPYCANNPKGSTAASGATGG